MSKGHHHHHRFGISSEEEDEEGATVTSSVILDKEFVKGGGEHTGYTDAQTLWNVMCKYYKVPTADIRRAEKKQTDKLFFNFLESEWFQRRAKKMSRYNIHQLRSVLNCADYEGSTQDERSLEHKARTRFEQMAHVAGLTPDELSSLCIQDFRKCYADLKNCEDPEQNPMYIVLFARYRRIRLLRAQYNSQPDYILSS